MSELVSGRNISDSRGTPLPVSQKKVRLCVVDDLDSMAYGWTPQELNQKRRIVMFEGTQTADVLTVSFRAATVADQLPSGIFVSCIWWADKRACFLTSADTVRLLEGLLQISYTKGEKDRMRSLFQSFRPHTVSKNERKTHDFFRVLRSFGEPKPYHSARPTKLLRWKDLTRVLRELVDLHEVSGPPTQMTNTMISRTPRTRRRAAVLAAESALANPHSPFNVLVSPPSWSSLSTRGHQTRTLPPVGLPRPQTMCTGVEGLTGYYYYGVPAGHAAGSVTGQLSRYDCYSYSSHDAPPPRSHGASRPYGMEGAADAGGSGRSAGREYLENVRRDH
ncbi:hypothetical protein NKR23_g8978 [Pleurostoma richardsiae]|uniref:DUF7082 domain-containing protein n=1 Tax=Pleurostoma richardsiae TaxID=41990 RepID=A0AA38RGT6_9PEZI|nr:hypothetical protein NKR23_g8978 [Pleurostoma richardsiae]